MGERESRRAAELREIEGEVKASARSDGIARQVRVVRMWECRDCNVAQPRGEACGRCGKQLLEG